MVADEDSLKDVWGKGGESGRWKVRFCVSRCVANEFASRSLRGSIIGAIRCHLRLIMGSGVAFPHVA